MHLKLFTSIGSLWGEYYTRCYCTSLPNVFSDTGSFNSPTVGGSIYTREFGKPYKSGLYLLLLTHKPDVKHLSAYHYFAPHWAQDQACSQLRVLISNFTNIGRGLQNLPKALSLPSQSHFA